ncbi:MAG: DUF11 domain-containing protein, partial [Calditrichaeota bacterium]
FLAGSDGSIISNVEIFNFPDAGLYINANDVIVDECTIHDNEGAGILTNGSRRCQIGSVLGNYIYDNNGTSGDGIQLHTDIFNNTSDSNIIYLNNIGTIDGTTASPNERAGIRVFGEYNRILNNLVSGNNYDGIVLGEDSAASSLANVIDENIIGLTLTSDDTLPNGHGNNGEGIYIRYGESDTITENSIGGNIGNGIEFASEGNNAYISDNSIGIYDLFTEHIGNLGSGIFLRGNSNIITDNYCGNNLNGIVIAGDSNHVKSNHLGSIETTKLPNAVDGVRVSGNYNLVGGMLTERNICSGNSLYGITVSGAGSTGNIIQNNIIGTDSSTTYIISNGRDGIRITDSVQSTQILDNLIEGNDSSGVMLSATFGRRPRGTIFERNQIGLPLLFLDGNRTSGIVIKGAVETYIGNPMTGEGNLIAYNDFYGIDIRNGDSTIIVNNHIFYNEGSGIFIDSGKHNQIIDCNINSNDYHGVYIEDADSTYITGDSIYYNGGNAITVITGKYNRFIKNYIAFNDYLGIDLGNDSNTDNDVNDIDDGPNEFQNYPAIFSVTNVSDSLLIVGEVDGLPFTDYLIEMYANYYCDSSGYGEGEEWLDSVTVTSIGDGTAVIDFKSASTYDPSYSNLTFTATDNNGNTSEFSPCFEYILAAADIGVTMVSDKDSVMVADTVTFTITVTNNGVDQATNVTVIDTIPSSLSYASDSSSQGSSVLTDNVLSSSIGTLASGAYADIILKVTADSVASLANRCIASAAEHDPVPQNNSVQDSVEVVDNLTSIISDDTSNLPTEFQLSQNYPNPFNPSTTIEFSLPAKSFVTIEIINISGQIVKQLVSREVAAGNYKVSWDGLNNNGEHVSSGMYFYRFKTDEHIESKKMLLLK